jgi:hypothetical protein
MADAVYWSLVTIVVVLGLLVLVALWRIIAAARRDDDPIV